MFGHTSGPGADGTECGELRRERLPVRLCAAAARARGVTAVSYTGRGARLLLERVQREPAHFRLWRRQPQALGSQSARHAPTHRLQGAPEGGACCELEPREQGLLPLCFMGRTSEALVAGLTTIVGNLAAASARVGLFCCLVAAVGKHVCDRLAGQNAQGFLLRVLQQVVVQGSLNHARIGVGRFLTAGLPNQRF